MLPDESVEAYLASVEAALADADATLSTDLGGARELTQVRLWHGQVLVDWEPDAEVGDCLLRPALLRRLVALDARVSLESNALRLFAAGRVVAALSPHHATLVQQLGGAKRVALSLDLSFEQQTYRGGDETYTLADNRRRLPLMQLHADVRVRTPRAAPPPSSPSGSDPSAGRRDSRTIGM